jgi:hypothetical protein
MDVINLLQEFENDFNCLLEAFQSDDINWNISEGEMFRPGNNTVNYITDREINPDDILRPLNQDEKNGQKVLYRTGIFKPAVNAKELMESLNEGTGNIYLGIPPESKANRRDIGVKSVSLKQNHTTFTTAERQKLANEGKALPDGSYPIRNKSDLKDAIKSYGLGKDHEAAKKHIIKRAKALGAPDLIPQKWQK